MRVPHGTTILVADGRKRLFARNEGDAEAIDLKVFDAAETAARPTHEIATDAAGRGPGGSGTTGAAPLAGSDPHDHEEERFAVETADLLRQGVERGRFDKIVIVAAPRTLGVLRKHVHKMVSERIVAEVDKDLTGQSVDAIGKALAAHD